MSRSIYEGFYGADDWFIATEPEKSLFIAGFDRHLRLDEELEAFVHVLREACHHFSTAFNVIFWCGPGMGKADADALRQFEALVQRLRREGARRFGLVLARRAQIDAGEYEARLGGGLLTCAATIAEAERLLAIRAEQRKAAARAGNVFSLTVG